MKNAKSAFTETAILDRLLDPLTRRLTPAAARVLVEFRADAATQSRIAELADKCNEGELTPSERAEYEAYVRAHCRTPIKSPSVTQRPKTVIDDRLREAVRQRVRVSCEYCKLPEAYAFIIPFQIEHIIARKHGLPTIFWQSCACLRPLQSFQGH